MRGSTVVLVQTAVFGTMLILGAGLLHADPLYVPGIALLLVVALSAAWVQVGRRGVRISRTVSARRVAEDEPVTIDVTVTSRHRLPSGAVVDPLLSGPAKLAMGQGGMRIRMVARFPARGRRALASPRVMVRDPLGLMTRLAAATVPVEEVLVLPRIEPVLAPNARDEGTGSPVIRRRSPVAAEIDLDGLRQHRAGSPASRIFWPSLARGGELMERQLSADGDTRPLIVLDPRGAEGSEDLDAAVRAVASLAMHLGRRGGCAVLLPGDRRPVALEPSLAGWSRLHVRLALLEGDAAPMPRAVTARRGPVLFVVAQRVARPPRALTNAPGGSRLLVVPGALAGRRPSFTVAGCFGYELSDVRRAEVSLA